MRTPHPLIEIVDGQFDDKYTLAARPLIAFDAAGEQLAITVNLDQPFPATVALHLSDSS